MGSGNVVSGNGLISGRHESAASPARASSASAGGRRDERTGVGRPRRRRRRRWRRGRRRRVGSCRPSCNRTSPADRGMRRARTPPGRSAPPTPSRPTLIRAVSEPARHRRGPVGFAGSRRPASAPSASTTMRPWPRPPATADVTVAPHCFAPLARAAHRCPPAAAVINTTSSVRDGGLVRRWPASCGRCRPWPRRRRGRSCRASRNQRIDRRSPPCVGVAHHWPRRGGRRPDWPDPRTGRRPAPTASTVPATSRPGVIGSSGTRERAAGHAGAHRRGRAGAHQRPRRRSEPARRAGRGRRPPRPRAPRGPPNRY